MSRKYALIIGNTEYSDPGLAQLTAPGKDAEDFARVLQSKDICDFDDVKVSIDQSSSFVIEAIDEFFDQKKPDDLLVLYFSGHGIKDESGSLYLAFKNTVRSRLRSTAIKSDYIREAMDQSRSKRQVLVLDCCNSGAFPQGAKAETGSMMGMTRAFQGYGRFVLTASDSTQFAWEGDKVIGETDNSLFTHFLVKGLEGEADNDGDGRITVDELYDYAYGQISKVTPKQTPTKSSTKQEGEIVLRQNMRIDDIKPIPLPTPLLDSIENPFSDVRLGAVQQLTKLLNGKNLGLARSAKEALERVAEEDDSRQVSRAAFQALDAIRQVEQATVEEAQKVQTKIEVEQLFNEKAELERLAKQKDEKESIAKADIEAERLAEEKLHANEKEAANRKTQNEVTKSRPNSRRLPIFKWAVIITISLFVIVAGAATVSYLASLGEATPLATEYPIIFSQEDCVKAEVFCVGLVTDVGKIDDKSFNQSAWEGVQQSNTDGVADFIQFIETTDAKDYAKNIAQFGDTGFDVIVTVGFGLGEATASAATTYPNVRFIGVDQFQNETIPGVSGLNFPEDNAGFLVGALAAMMSESHKIGAVCGTDVVPAVWRFGEGYKAGASYADDLYGTNTEVFVVYHSDVGFDKAFTDPEWGSQTATSMMNQGADVIFGCGGITGNGAITAAAQVGAYAIGVDTDQYLNLPEAAPRMLSSAIKYITPGVADLIKGAKDGTIINGNIFGSAGYAPFHDLEGVVPAEVKTTMEEIDAGLLNETITTNVSDSKP